MIKVPSSSKTRWEGVESRRFILSSMNRSAATNRGLPSENEQADG